MEKDIDVINSNIYNKNNFSLIKNEINNNSHNDSFMSFKSDLKSFQLANNTKKYSLNDKINQKKVILNYNINDAITQNNVEISNIPSSNVAILVSKRAILDNDFVSSLSNFQLNYNSITDKGILLQKTYTEHIERINDIDIINEHSALASASNDGTIKLWDLKGLNNSVKTFNAGKPVWSVHTHGEFLCAGIEKDLVIWSLKTMKPFAKINFLHSEAILSIKIQLINGKPYLITTGDDGLINVVDISTPKITTDSIVSTINTNQTILSAELVNDINIVQAITASENLVLYNLENNSEIVSFDFKAEGLGSNYIVNSKIVQNKTDEITVTLGSNR